MRKYDITVLGATGYVGRRLAAELEKLSKALDLRLAATTRSQAKNDELRKVLPSFDFEVLDIADPKAVDLIAAKSRLVINCIGPFDRYGENVVGACARAGTHYLDITGEILFGRRIIEKFDEMAKANQAMIVPFAGFDSVPSDISVYLAAQEMSEAHGQPVASIDLVFKARGGFNGGTAATALDMGAKLRKVDQENLSFLVPSEAARPSRGLHRPRYVASLGQWVAPFFMEPINNKVVYRSVALSSNREKQFTPDFHYRESMIVPGGMPGAMMATWALAGSELLLKSKAGRKLASLALPKPGEGPSEALMESGFFEATVFAVGSLGASVVRKMRSKGDPGNVSTVKMLLACVRVMRQRNFELQGGLFTPATAFGADLLPALRESGVSWG